MYLSLVWLTRPSLAWPTKLQPGSEQAKDGGECNGGKDWARGPPPSLCSFFSSFFLTHTHTHAHQHMYIIYWSEDRSVLIRIAGYACISMEVRLCVLWTLLMNHCSLTIKHQCSTYTHLFFSKLDYCACWMLFSLQRTERIPLLWF